MANQPQQVRRGMAAVVAAAVVMQVGVPGIRSDPRVYVGLGAEHLSVGEQAEPQAQMTDQDQQYDEGPQGPHAQRVEGPSPAERPMRGACADVHGQSVAEPSPSHERHTDRGDDVRRRSVSFQLLGPWAYILPAAPASKPGQHLWPS
jgi:hypothetical protein